MVFFEAPHRLEAFLRDAALALGADRPAAVCRELTKVHEEVRRGPLAELVAWAADGIRGEVTIVVQGAPPTAEVAGDPDSLRAAVAAQPGNPKPRMFRLPAAMNLHNLPWQISVLLWFCA